MSGLGPSNRSNDPTVRFLGPSVLRNGPFGVLGLPPGDVDDETVVKAVHDRMAQIDRHPEGRTPSADEARLAVHAAAANLLDPGVRAALVERLCSTQQPSRAATTTRTPPQRSARPSQPSAGRPVSAYQLEADLLRSIGAEGGWGPAARDRFIKLAHARGVDASTAASSVGPLAGAIGRGAMQQATVIAEPRSAAPPRVAAAAPSPATRGPQQDVPQGNGIPPAQRSSDDDHPRTGQHVELLSGTPSGSSMLTSVLVVASIVVLMVLAAGVTLLIVGGENAPSELNTPPVRVVRPPVDPAPDSDAEAPRVSGGRELDNAPAILHELEVASEGLAVDPEAAFGGFERAVGSLAERWGQFSVSDRLAAQDLIIGFVYRVSGRGAMLDRAFTVLAAGVMRIGDPESPGRTTGADDVWRAAWSTGTLVRLRREANLPGSLARRIDGTIAPVFAGGAPNAQSFRAGAIAMLRRLADPLSPAGIDSASREVWDAWVEAVVAASLGDEELIASMLIAAADGRLRQGSRDSAGDTETLAAVIGAMDWSEGSAARSWLVRAFGDRSLGVDELHAITLALANESAAGGVNHAMVLPRNAGEFDRRALRERFRELWGIAQDADTGETLAVFLASARDEIDAEPARGGEGFGLDELSEAVRLARLNTAAAMIWRAEFDPAADLLKALDDPINAVLNSDGVPNLSGLLRTGGGTWAQEYLSAGSHIDERLDLLSMAGSRASLGPMEAEVIVAEALRGSPIRVREAASVIVESEASTPTIVNAVLEALPLMPKSARNGALVQRIAGVSLPGIGDPTWDVDARRALVERLLELIAGRGEYARLDALSGLLDEAYTDRLNAMGVNPSSAGEARVDSDASARELTARWIAAAERRPPAPISGLSVESIVSRRAARLSSADGIVQVFHAHQLALAESMALVIAGEGSARAGDVGTMLADLTRSRGRSRSVLQQIEQTERFMLRLWIARFEEGV